MACLLFGCNKTENDIEHEFSVGQLKNDFEVYRKVLEKGHPALNQYITKTALNKLFDSCQQAIQEPMTQRQFYNLLNIINQRIGCAHTYIEVPKEVQTEMEKLEGFFPAPVIIDSNRIIFNSADYDVPLGAEITSINKHKTKDILSILGRYNQGDGYNETKGQSALIKDFSFYYFMAFHNEKEFVIDYLYADTTGNVTGKKTIAAEKYGTVLSKFSERAAYYIDAHIDYDLEFLEGNTALLTINNFSFFSPTENSAYEHFIDNAFELMQHKGVQNLILDIRYNSGGIYDCVKYVASYLVNRPERKFKSVITNMNRVPYPEYTLTEDSSLVESINSMLSDELEEGKKKNVLKEENMDTILFNENGFKGNIFVLQTGETNSAASYFSALLKNENRCITVGEETGGGAHSHNGFETISYQLPNTKINFGFAIVHVVFNVNKDISPFGHGVPADKPVHFHAEHLIDNFDPYIAYVLDSLIK
jgi:hypothetical protein